MLNLSFKSHPRLMKVYLGSTLTDAQLIAEIDGNHEGFPGEWFVRYYHNRISERFSNFRYPALHMAIGKVVRHANMILGDDQVFNRQ